MPIGSSSNFLWVLFLFLAVHFVTRDEKNTLGCRTAKTAGSEWSDRANVANASWCWKRHVWAWRATSFTEWLRIQVVHCPTTVTNQGLLFTLLTVRNMIGQAPVGCRYFWAAFKWGNIGGWWKDCVVRTANATVTTGSWRLASNITEQPGGWVWLFSQCLFLLIKQNSVFVWPWYRAFRIFRQKWVEWIQSYKNETMLMTILSEVMQLKASDMFADMTSDKIIGHISFASFVITS